LHHPKQTSHERNTVSELQSSFAQLEALDAAQIDPVRWHFALGLSRRLEGQTGAVRVRLEQRLAQVLAELKQAVAGHEPAGTTMPPRAVKATPLADLLSRLRPAAAVLPLADASHQRVGVQAPSELRAVSAFRQTWARLSVARQVDQVMRQAPENAGPLNAHQLVLRAMSAMREVSPEYLHEFVSWADTLLWLEDSAAAKATIKPPRRRKS
jgi:hypothetical protein